MLLCKNCDHFYEYFDRFYCVRNAEREPVLGEYIIDRDVPLCVDERNGSCGKDAKFFKSISTYYP